MTTAAKILHHLPEQLFMIREAGKIRADFKRANTAMQIAERAVLKAQATHRKAHAEALRLSYLDEALDAIETAITCHECESLSTVALYRTAEPVWKLCDECNEERLIAEAEEAERLTAEAQDQPEHEHHDEADNVTRPGVEA